MQAITTPGKCVAEIVCVEEFCEVFDGRWTGEGDAVAAAGEHCAQTAAIEILRKHGLIRRNDIDARACFFQCFRQDIAADGRARQQNVEPVQMFVAAGEFAERCKHAFCS